MESDLCGAQPVFFSFVNDCREQDDEKLGRWRYVMVVRCNEK